MSISAAISADGQTLLVELSDLRYASRLVRGGRRASPACPRPPLRHEHLVGATGFPARSGGDNPDHFVAVHSGPAAHRLPPRRRPDPASNGPIGSRISG